MVGFIPLVLAKAGMIIFRYYWIFHVDSKTQYFGVQTKLDAAVLAVTAWSDLFNSIVIVYAGTETKRFRRNEFLSNLVRTTELRIVVCTVLVFVAVFFTLIDNCLGDPTAQGNCRYKGARDIVVNVVYSLYLMDYLVIKFHRVFQTEKTIRQQQKPRTILNKENTAKVPWPVFGLGRAPSLTMNQPSRSSQVYDRSQTQTDLDTPSFVILKKAAKYYPSKNSSQTFQKSQLGASSLGPSTKELSISTNPSNNNSEESLPSKSTDSPNSTSKKQQKQPIRGIERTNTHKSNKSRLSVTVAASSAVSYSDSVIEKHDEDNASSSDFSPAESVPLKSVVGMNAYQKANESGEGSSVWYEDENSTLKRQTAVPKNEPRRQVLSKLFGTNR
ncbi:hypothetical protein HK098_003067 [Nowakowskiella sp. JEL0407]|nr:hypothetical protein HK098_003067 [Nowakowskiella sp. JEL0407]